MNGRLSGQVAIVTGAGRGIGRAEALALAAEGCRVLVNDRGAALDGSGSEIATAQRVADEIRERGGEALANGGDVTSMADAEAMVQAALDAWGRLDVLVNNAGIVRDRMIFNMSEEEWDAVIAVHLKGHFTVSRFASAVFRQQRSGRIINTSSESGLGNPGQANYATAKEGIVGFTRTLALELGRYNVTVNAIRPRAATRMTLPPPGTPVPTPTATGTRLTAAQEALSRIDEMQPELVAPLVVYLCTAEASGVTGRDFIVGGDEISLMSLPTRERSMFREGGWTVDAIAREFPATLGTGI